MYVLYLDSHSSLITLLLFKDGKIIVKREKDSNLSHSVFVMPLIEEVLKEAKISKNELNEIYVVIGPGSFTGVRIGVTIAKTLAYCLEIPCKALTSIEVKVACSEMTDRIIVENEKNGKFLGRFNSKNELIEDYKYLSTNEYDTFVLNNEIMIIENIEIDYEKVYEYISNKEYISVHNLNPLYIKNLEV